MPTITLETMIDAPISRCFDLARDVEVHTRSTKATRERAVVGVTSGLLGLGDEVTWEAVHFGIRQRLTSRITEFDPPRRFADQMVKGVFHSLTHVHTFESVGNGTLMRDLFVYVSPLGILGRVADVVFLQRYMTRLLQQRNAILKEVAEAGPAC